MVSPCFTSDLVFVNFLHLKLLIGTAQPAVELGFTKLRRMMRHELLCQGVALQQSLEGEIKDHPLEMAEIHGNPKFGPQKNHESDP